MVCGVLQILSDFVLGFELKSKNKKLYDLILSYSSLKIELEKL